MAANCIGGLWVLALLNGQPLGSACITGPDDIPVAAIVEAVRKSEGATTVEMASAVPCPYSGSLADLTACEPRLTAQMGDQVLHLHYGAGHSRRP